jgi:hypothetical protein
VAEFGQINGAPIDPERSLKHIVTQDGALPSAGVETCDVSVDAGFDIGSIAGLGILPGDRDLP